MVPLLVTGREWEGPGTARGSPWQRRGAEACGRHNIITRWGPKREGSLFYRWLSSGRSGCDTRPSVPASLANNTDDDTDDDNDNNDDDDDDDDDDINNNNIIIALI